MIASGSSEFGPELGEGWPEVSASSDGPRPVLGIRIRTNVGVNEVSQQVLDAPGASRPDGDEARARSRPGGALRGSSRGSIRTRPEGKSGIEAIVADDPGTRRVSTAQRLGFRGSAFRSEPGGRQIAGRRSGGRRSDFRRSLRSASDPESGEGLDQSVGRRPTFNGPSRGPFDREQPRLAVEVGQEVGDVRLDHRSVRWLGAISASGARTNRRNASRRVRESSIPPCRRTWRP